MATGTEGPDFLSNDTSVTFDSIDGRGGDDFIDISTSPDEHIVAVEGGSGFDTLRVGGFIRSVGPNSIITGQGTFSPLNEVYHGGIERLMIHGTALPYEDQFGGALPVFVTTGDTIDDISLDSLRGGAVIVSTGGGDDQVTLGPVGAFSTVRGGAGNDRISLAASPFGFLSAFGEEGNDTLFGSPSDDRLEGGPGDDILYLDAAGVETATGDGGKDTFYFGRRLTALDKIDGGSEIDRLVLQGDYGSGLVLTANVTGIETMSLLSGSEPFLFLGGSDLYDYVVTTHDSNFAPGLQARIEGAGLLAGEDLTFNGSAETDARFLVYGGKGIDRLTGGLGNDIFFFGDSGRFAPGDIVNGGPGSDGLYLRGNYTIDFNAAGYAGALTGIETLFLSSVTDERYFRGVATEFDYNFVWADALLGPGQTITIDGTFLRPNETLTFDGSRESDGSFRIVGGAAADLLSGGRSSDVIYGALGADRMIGNGGNDVFHYELAADSTSAARDTVRDFTLGDRVDLLRVDANILAPGNHAFTFIGSAAFGSRPGELRVENQGGPVWLVQGDTDGNGISDFELTLIVVDAHPITAGDFLL